LVPPPEDIYEKLVYTNNLALKEPLKKNDAILETAISHEHNQKQHHTKGNEEIVPTTIGRKKP